MSRNSAVSVLPGDMGNVRAGDSQIGEFPVGEVGKLANRLAIMPPILDETDE